MQYLTHHKNNKIEKLPCSRFLSICLLTASTTALANPTGGQVVGGSASIDYGTTTTITQTTNKAIINWEGFSIDASQITEFKQPSSSSVTLNRVVGNDLSNIQGQLKANGQIILVNPNGIVFGPNARVDVAGLVASTADIANDDFMAGNFIFADAPEGSSIINYGEISVKDAGMAALVAPSVQNYGIINANMGNVVLHSGNQFTIDLYGDGLISYDADVLVENGYINQAGEIYANGGNVMISVSAADTVLESLINVDGYIEAKTVGDSHGTIVLLGDTNSELRVAGTLNVSGDDAGESGGVIQATANFVQLTGATLDASGDAGGGTIHVGSDLFHNPADDPNINTFGLPVTLRTSEYVYIDTESYLDVSADTAGDGGDIVIWADDSTAFYGDIMARGGILSGDGGRVETSGQIYLHVSDDASINIGATYGSGGIWLLDPYNITITPATTSNGTYTPGDPQSTFDPTGNDAEVSAATIVASLNGNGEVVVSTDNGGAQAGNITVSAPITTTSTLSSLILFANGEIFVNEAITGGMDLDLLAFSDISIDAELDVSDLRVASGGTISATADVTATSFFIDTAGNWIQNSATLPEFNITGDFNPAAGTFQRVAGGTGTVGNPFIIQDVYGLYGISSSLGSSYRLSNNIDGVIAGTVDVSQWSISGGGTGFTPIGSTATPFTGTFDGNQFTITDISITKTANDMGIFGNTNGATLEEVRLANITLDITGDEVGALVGDANNTTINSIVIASSVTVDGTNSVGGVAGTLDGGSTLSNVMYVGSTSGGDSVGGIVGTNNGTVRYVLGIGTVSGSSAVGQLIGTLNGTLTGGLVNTDISTRAGVGVGSNANVLATTSGFFTLQSTYTNVGFTFASDQGWRLIPGFYASPYWCGSSCAVSLNATAPNTTQTQSALTTTQRIQDSSPVLVSTITFIPGTMLIEGLLTNLGVDTSLLTPGQLEILQEIAVLEFFDQAGEGDPAATFAAILPELIKYYCGTQ